MTDNLYRVLKDRFVRSETRTTTSAMVGDIVKEFKGYTYGLVSDDENATGIEHMAVCHLDSEDVFFTIPVEDLEPVTVFEASSKHN